MTETEHLHDEATTHLVSEKKNGNMNYIVIGLILLVVAVLGYKFIFARSPKMEKDDQVGKMTTTTQTGGSPSTSPQEPSVFDATTAQADADGVVTIPVEAGSFYYKPNEIHAKKGQKIKIQLNSVDMMHNFVIDELGVNMPVTKAGNSATADFTASMVGQFEYYCAVGQHRQHGQVGKLIITE